MFKKFSISLCLLVTLLQASFLKAEDSYYYTQPCCEEEGCFFQDFSAEGRFSAFFPLDSRASDIFGTALPCFELELATVICDSWRPWFDVGYIYSNGRSLGGGDKTQLSLLPLALGVSYLFSCDCIDWYLGLGATYSFLHTEDHSPFVHEHVHKNAWGGTAKLGFYYLWTDYIFVEGFLDYIYQKFNFSTDEDSDPFVVRNNVNLSALKLGVGLGVRF